MDLANPDTEGSIALGWWGASPFYQENQPQLLVAGHCRLANARDRAGVQRFVTAVTQAHAYTDMGERTSHMLLKAVRGDSERISIGDIADALDSRAFGLAVLIFSLPSIVPMPPGVPTVVGIALLIVSFQMVIGRHELWLPGFLAKRSFPRKSLVSALEKLVPRLEAEIGRAHV